MSPRTMTSRSSCAASSVTVFLNCARMELLLQQLELVRLRRAPMPFVDIVGEGLATVTLHGVADDDADALGRRSKGLLERVEIVTVDLDDPAAERGETLPGIRDRQATSLGIIIVVEHGEIVEL